MPVASIQLVTVALFQVHTETAICPHASLCRKNISVWNCSNQLFQAVRELAGDPFVTVAAGRCLFRYKGLLKLVDLVRGLFILTCKATNAVNVRISAVQGRVWVMRSSLYVWQSRVFRVGMAEADAKLLTLQQQGTLNPRPKDVRDELFLQDKFFDPHDMVYPRLAIAQFNIPPWLSSHIRRLRLGSSGND